MRIIYAVLILMLSSCTQISQQKSYTITDFTEELKTSANGANTISISSARNISSWIDSLNSVNLYQQNLLAAKEVSALKSAKLSAANINTAPIIAEDKIFILDTKNVVTAFNKNTFKEVWKTSLNDQKYKSHNTGTLIYKEGKLIVANATKDIFILDAASGKKLTIKRLGDVIKTGITVEGKTLYALTISNILYSIDIESGKILWQHRYPSESLITEMIAGLVVSQDKLIVPFSSGVVTVFDLKKAREVFSLNLAADSSELPGFSAVSIELQPIVKDDFIYIATSTGYLFKIHINNGAILWKKRIQDIKSMTLVQNAIYLVNNRAEAAAVDIDTGNIAWVTSLNQSNSKKAAITKRTTPIVPSNILIINNILVVSDGEGHLFKLNPRNGKIIDMISVPKKAIYGAVTAGVYYLFTNNSLVVHNH